MAAPTISTITPTSGPPGTMVSITGTGLSQVVAVRLGGVAASFSKISDTQLNFTVPSGSVAGVDDVVLTYRASETDPNAFTVTVAIPAPPTGLSATLSGTPAAPHVVLNWTASAGASSYDVYRNGALLATGVVMGTYTDIAPPLNATDTYSVSAVNSAGQSAQTAGVAVGVPSALAAPTGLAASQIGLTSFVLSWNAVAGATGYIPYENGTALAAVTGTSVTITGLPNGFTAAYTVAARDALGTGPQATAINVTTLSVQIPPPPTGLTAVLGGTPTAPTVILNWTDSAGATSYDIYRNGVLIATGVPG